MIAIGIYIISILLVVIIWLLWKLLHEMQKTWVMFANVTEAIDKLTNSIDLYRKDFKLTFDDKFAKRVEEIVGLGVPPSKTMRAKCMDGKEHILPIDEGY